MKTPIPKEPFDGLDVTEFYRRIGEGDLAAAHDAIARVWNDDVRHALYGEMRLRAVEWGDLGYARLAAQFSSGALDAPELARCRDAAIKAGRVADALGCASQLGCDFEPADLKRLAKKAREEGATITAEALQIACGSYPNFGDRLLALLLHAKSQTLTAGEELALAYVLHVYNEQPPWRKK